MEELRRPFLEEPLPKRQLGAVQPVVFEDWTPDELAVFLEAYKVQIRAYGIFTAIARQSMGDREKLVKESAR